MNRQEVKRDVERIMDLYGELIFKTCFMMVKNKYDAEDIVQDTYMKYISYLAEDHEFESDEHKKAWLLRVSQNKCKDLLKYKNKHTHIAYEDVEECLLCGNNYEQEDMDEFLKFANLSYEHKSVIMLHYIEGFSVEETANILNISVSATKMRLKRGREKLKVAYEKNYEEEVL